MPYEIDVLLTGARVVDPSNGFDGVMDLAVAGGKIAEVAESIPAKSARDVHDLSGFTLIPGIIDSHVHASALSGGACAHKMLARAGVTTALEMAGPVGSVWKLMRESGAGLNMACVHAVAPGFSVKSKNPAPDELQELFDSIVRQGAVGFKILGGHFPLTPEATARCVELAAQNRGYCAIHAGSTATASDLSGFLEAVELSGGKNLHVAHINSYCRGAQKTSLQEALTAARALEDHPNIFSESYLSPLNGTSGRIVDNRPASAATARTLAALGFEPSADGMRRAIEQGAARVLVEEGGEMVLQGGPAAVSVWEAVGMDANVSFDVNPADSRFLLATCKRGDGRFGVDCIATDGGGFPRNVIVENGLALVDFRALSLNEFVLKTSTNPARMLGLKNKGTLGVGADADITVLDRGANKAFMGLAGGRIIMYAGHVTGARGTALTLSQGRAHVESEGLRVEVIDPADFFERQPLSTPPAPPA